MIRTIVLDSAPLGLIVHQRRAPIVTECRRWLAGHLATGIQAVVPAIVAYELRRELLRLNHSRSIKLLDRFVSAGANRYIELTDGHLRHAAQLWSDLRNRGRPTADPQALDIDVILAAQSLSLGLPVTDYVVATSNMTHLGLLVPAQEWRAI